MEFVEGFLSTFQQNQIISKLIVNNDTVYMCILNFHWISFVNLYSLYYLSFIKYKNALNTFCKPEREGPQ